MKQKLTNSKVVSEGFPMCWDYPIPGAYQYLILISKLVFLHLSFLADDPKKPCVVANLGEVSQPEWDFLVQSLYSIEMYIEINLLCHNDHQ
jgi:hypothetical protein